MKLNLSELEALMLVALRKGSMAQQALNAALAVEGLATAAPGTLLASVKKIHVTGSIYVDAAAFVQNGTFIEPAGFLCVVNHVLTATVKGVKVVADLMVYDASVK